MRMPAHYVDMNKEEMEYDGGQSAEEFVFDVFVGGIGLVGGLICWPVGVAAGIYSLADQASHYYNNGDGLFEYLNRFANTDASYPTSIPIQERKMPSRAYYP